VSAPIVWPATLPLYPGRDGLSGGKAPGKVSFQPESGPPIARAAQTARVDVYDCTFGPLTKTQIEAFRTFYDATLGQGSLKFAMAHPVKQVVREAQIIGEPTETNLATGWWVVSFSMMMVDVAPAYFADTNITNGTIVYTAP